MITQVVRSRYAQYYSLHKKHDCDMIAAVTSDRTAQQLVVIDTGPTVQWSSIRSRIVDDGVKMLIPEGL